MAEAPTPSVVPPFGPTGVTPVTAVANRGLSVSSQAIAIDFGNLQAKNTPVAADLFLIGDSAASNAPKYTSITNMVSALTPLILAKTETVAALGTYSAVLTKTASFTLSNTELNTFFNCSHAATPIVVTVPLNTTVAIPVGTRYDGRRNGDAAVSFVAEGGVTIESEDNYLVVNKKFSMWSIVKTDTNVWALTGSLKA